MSKKKRYTSNRTLAHCIEEGLKHISEDHDVFVGNARFDTFCGCALAIALAGLCELICDEKMKAPHIGSDIRDIDSQLVAEIAQGRIDPVAMFAESLGISRALAERIDVLHRQNRYSALEIAQMLRLGEI